MGAKFQNPIAGWIRRQVERGYRAFALMMREGAAVSLVDQYTVDKDVADRIYRDAIENAQAFDHPTVYLVRALRDGDGPTPTRTFSIAGQPPLHEPDRYEMRHIDRLLLEHIDKQNRVIAQVVPACIAAMGSMVQGMGAHFTALADTHESAIRAIRSSKVDQLEAERQMKKDARRDARVGKLIEVGLSMVPQLVGEPEVAEAKPKAVPESASGGEEPPS